MITDLPLIEVPPLIEDLPLLDPRGRLKSPPQSLQPPSKPPIHPFSFTHQVIRSRETKGISIP